MDTDNRTQLVWMNSATRTYMLSRGHIFITALSDKPGVLAYLTHPCEFVKDHELFPGRRVGVNDRLGNGRFYRMLDDGLQGRERFAVSNFEEIR